MDRQYNRTRVKGQTMNHKTLHYKGRVTLRPHKHTPEQGLKVKQ